MSRLRLIVSDALKKAQKMGNLFVKNRPSLAKRQVAIGYPLRASGVCYPLRRRPRSRLLFPQPTARPALPPSRCVAYYIASDRPIPAWFIR